MVLQKSGTQHVRDEGRAVAGAAYDVNALTVANAVTQLHEPFEGPWSRVLQDRAEKDAVAGMYSLAGVFAGAQISQERMDRGLAGIDFFVHGLSFQVERGCIGLPIAALQVVRSVATIAEREIIPALLLVRLRGLDEDAARADAKNRDVDGFSRSACIGVTAGGVLMRFAERYSLHAESETVVVRIMSQAVPTVQDGTLEAQVRDLNAY